IFEFFPISFLLSNISVVCKEWYSYVWNSHTLWHTLELNLMEPIMFEPFKSFCKLHTKKLKSVKRLIYTSDKVTFVSIHGILDYFNCSSLNYIQWNYWNDSNMDRLSSFTNLTELGFRYCNLQNLDGIEYLTKLTKLYLQDCPYLENLDGIASLINLSKLDLQYCKKLQNVYGLSKLTQLRELNLRHCDNIFNVDVFTTLTELTE